MKKIAKVSSPRGREIFVQEQALPGDAEHVESEAIARGLPDAVLHDGEAWCLVIESKVGASPSMGQLRRHRATIERRGFSSINLLLITASPPAPRFLRECQYASWSEIYSWLRAQAKQSAWAMKVAEYLEIQERRLLESGYLKEGALTEFSGFDFGPDHPYNYLEAKQMLRLAMHDLRQLRDLESQLSADLSEGGRKAITGREAISVWDFIPLRGSAGEAFTSFPHLTLSIAMSQVFAHITIPNSVGTKFRNNLKSLGFEQFLELVLKVEGRLQPVLQKAPGAAPWFRAVQRRYRSQRSVPIIDAVLEFDLRTAVQADSGSERPLVKSMPEWIEAAYSAWTSRSVSKANYQLTLGAIFPFDSCEAVRRPEAVRLIADTWLACKPLLSAVCGRG